jgi:tetraacyldisaccharide 4'-kinase
MSFPPVIRALLWPLSLVYGLAVRLRAWLYAHQWLKQKKLNGAVVSVGNITVGGTGKTPMVIWLAEKFLAEGKRVAILSRGYRGAGGTSDEIELMKHRLQGRVIFGVGQDRFAEGSRLEAQQSVDVFLLDDGFQHLQLARDADIVLVDSTRPLRNEFLLPAGRLREPRSALNRAHLVLFTRTEHSKSTVFAIQKCPKCAIYPSLTKLLGLRKLGSADSRAVLREPVAGPFFAFCGIGNPEAFFRDLERWGVVLAGRQTFRDHHRYTQNEAERLERAAESVGAKGLVTTEKDAQNIAARLFSRMSVDVAVISMEIPDETKFLDDLRNRLQSNRGVAA